MCWSRLVNYAMLEHVVSMVRTANSCRCRIVFGGRSRPAEAALAATCCFAVIIGGEGHSRTHEEVCGEVGEVRRHCHAAYGMHTWGRDRQCSSPLVGVLGFTGPRSGSLLECGRTFGRSQVYVCHRSLRGGWQGVRAAHPWLRVVDGRVVRNCPGTTVNE